MNELNGYLIYNGYIEWERAKQTLKIKLKNGVKHETATTKTKKTQKPNSSSKVKNEVYVSSNQQSSWTNENGLHTFKKGNPIKW